MRLLKAIFKPSRLVELWRCRRLTPDWARLTAAYLHIPGEYPLLVRTATGPVELRTRFDAATFWLVHIQRSYPVPSKAALILDAGANIGAFTLFALQNAPQSRVIALEPAPDSVQRIADMLQAHNLSDRCELVQQALGTAPGRTYIDLNVESQFRSTGGTHGTEVPVTSLEQIVSKHGPIDYLKIDAEGAEYPSLLHAPPHVLNQIGCIVMEYHPAESYTPDSLLNHLVSQGFTLSSRRDDGGNYGLAHLVRTDWKPTLRFARSSA